MSIDDALKAQALRDVLRSIRDTNTPGDGLLSAQALGLAIDEGLAVGGGGTYSLTWRGLNTLASLQ